MTNFEIARPEPVRSDLEKLVPRRFSEFICCLAQHRNNYTLDLEYKAYDALCRKHVSTRQIANYILASAHNESKPSAGQVKHLFDIPEATTYKVTRALREIGYIDNKWMPMPPLVELNRKRTLAFFDNPVFYMFIVSCMTYYIVRRARKIEQVFSVGYWLNLFDEKPTIHTNPIFDWNFYPDSYPEKGSREDSSSS